MKIEVQSIDIIGITRNDALNIRNEINKLTNGNLSVYPDKYPALHELDRLLNGCFDSMVHDVHFISKRS